MLKELEDEEEAITIDKVRKESLQWETEIIKQTMRQFPKIESLYEAYKSTTLPLVLLNFKHNMHVDELMPHSPLELLGGYKPLTQDEINGRVLSPNKPLWH